MITLIIFIIWIILVWTIQFYALYRNNWVYKYRINIIGTPDWERKYNNLPSYETMVFLQPFKFNYDEYLED